MPCPAVIDRRRRQVEASAAEAAAAAHYSTFSRHCTAAAASSGGTMSSSSPETTTEAASSSSSSSRKFKGVRKRKWGKWVSEIRLPNSRERIWLGSYDAPDKAARAFDAAFVCLRGRGADLNFPDSPPPCRRAGGCSSDPREVQAAALSHANRGAAVTAQQAAASLVMDDADADSGCSAPPWDYCYYSVAATSAAEVVAPVRADGSIDWRPVVAHPPPLFSPTGRWGTNAYDFLQVPSPAAAAAADDDMFDDGVHGATASLWSFDSRDSFFRY